MKKFIAGLTNHHSLFLIPFATIISLSGFSQQVNVGLKDRPNDEGLPYASVLM